MKLCIIAGTRPNFMKIAPIIDSIADFNRSNEKKIDYNLVHTGQHYDQKMSKLFFDNLGIPAPNIDLEVGSASHAVQTAEIMKRFEKTCLQENPTHIIVVGDVNSTIACALVASKIGIKIIHVEAGLRSFDHHMPEEINRVLTDAISDILFTTEESANQNLKREGISDKKIHFVGNVMIDTLLKHKKKARQSDILKKLCLINSQYINLPLPIKDTGAINPYSVLTLHRPSNVDNKKTFQGILEALMVIGEKVPIVFPMHPRTSKRVKDYGLEHFFNWDLYNSTGLISPGNYIYPIPPLGYLDFLNLMSNAKLVLTDSGGIQEETTILGIPCVTLRENTERPVTVNQGTNMISGVKKENIVKLSLEQLNKFTLCNQANVPPLWDGRAAERIVEVLIRKY